MSRPVTLFLDHIDRRIAYFDGNTFAYRNLIAAIPGAMFKQNGKRWQIPVASVGAALQIFPSLRASEEVKEAARYEQKRSQAAIAAKSRDFRSIVPQPIPGIKGLPRSYQQLGIDFLGALGFGEGSILAFDMGTGKSITTLAYGQTLLNSGQIDYILVVCPSPLKYATWAKELKKFTDLPYTVIDGDLRDTVEWEDGTTQRLTGRELRKAQYQQFAFGSRVLIMNYELFTHDAGKDKWVFDQPLIEHNRSLFEFTVRRCNAYKGRKEDHKAGIQEAIQELLPGIVGDPNNWTIRKHKGEYALFRREGVPSILPPIDGRWLIIMDEAHRIKNPSSAMTKNLIEHLRPAARKVLGTGTPLENSIEELYALVDFCRPGLLGSFKQFRDRYMELDFFGSPIGPKPQMMQELRERLAPVMLRLTKAEALPELPPISRVDYGIDMTPLQQKLYDQLKEGITQNATTGEFTYMDAIVQLTRVQQLLDSPALLRDALGDPTLPLESGKLLELEGIINDLSPSRHKFLIFSQYSQMTDLLYDWITTARGDGPPIMTPAEVGYVKGGMRPLHIEQVREAFQEGDMKCVIMTTAGNYGLDLYKASYAICFDSLFNPQKMEQFLSRGHRSGNTEGLTAITMTTRNSYEERKQLMLEEKRELFRAIVDDDDLAFSRLFTVQDLLNLI